MKRFILTGSPGAGKTALLRLLETRGYPVIEEAATDVIALAQAEGRPEPWTEPGFVDAIVDLQERRRSAAAAWPGPVQVFDRSPVCTWALTMHLGQAPSQALRRAVERIERDGIYQRRVLFVRPLGFIEPTAARRISYDESLRFEQAHVEAYERFGYALIDIAPGTLAARADAAVAAMAPA